MFCTKCGGKLDPNARFCGRCGNPVEVLGTMGRGEGFKPQEMGGVDLYGNPAGRDSGKKIMVVWILAACLILLAGIGGIVFFFTFRERSAVRTETAGMDLKLKQDESLVEKDPTEDSKETDPSGKTKETAALSEEQLYQEFLENELESELGYLPEQQTGTLTLEEEGEEEQLTLTLDKASSGMIAGDIFDLDGDGVKEFFLMYGKIAGERVEYWYRVYTVDHQKVKLSDKGKILPDLDVLPEWPEERENKQKKISLTYLFLLLETMYCV